MHPSFKKCKDLTICSVFLFWYVSLLQNICCFISSRKRQRNGENTCVVMV